MTKSNMSALIGPNIMRRLSPSPMSMLKDVRDSNTICLLLFDHYEEIFAKARLVFLKHFFLISSRFSMKGRILLPSNPSTRQWTLLRLYRAQSLQSGLSLYVLRNLLSCGSLWAARHSLCCPLEPALVLRKLVAQARHTARS